MNIPSFPFPFPSSSSSILSFSAAHKAAIDGRESKEEGRGSASFTVWRGMSFMRVCIASSTPSPVLADTSICAAIDEEKVRRGEKRRSEGGGGGGRGGKGGKRGRRKKEQGEKAGHEGGGGV